ncbi:MAG: putative phosphoglycerate mutase [Candidatus Azotimanducaceae bacterium]
MTTNYGEHQDQKQQEFRQHRFEVPPGATDLILVRHGESRAATADNPFPLVDGHGDPELAAKGREQAVAVGERLKHLPVAAVYVTNLRRTHETAAPLCQHLLLNPRVEPELREVHLGDWEGGIFRIRAHEQHPLVAKMHSEERWDVIPGAETTDKLRQRVATGLQNIVRSHPGELIVAVLHGGVIGHILAEASGSRPFAFNGCDNGSISRIVVSSDGVVLRGFNDVSHLEWHQSMSAMPT